MRKILQQIINISTSSRNTPATKIKSRKIFLETQLRFSKHACLDRDEEQLPFSICIVQLQRSYKVFTAIFYLQAPREFPSRTESTSADKFRSRSSYMAYVRDCERRHFARQLLHAQAHYGLRPRSSACYPLLSLIFPSLFLSLSLALALANCILVWRSRDNPTDYVMLKYLSGCIRET